MNAPVGGAAGVEAATPVVQHVAFVTMQFPSPSETFATNDARHHRSAGVHITVHSLRSAHRRSRALLTERGLHDLPCSHNRPSATVRGLVRALRQPRLLVALLGWQARATTGRPLQFVKGLALTPRAFGILSELEELRPDVVHLYWSNYPSIVGFLVKRVLPDAVVSMAFVAHDLMAPYGGSRALAGEVEVVGTIAEVNVPAVAELTGVRAGAIAVVRHGIEFGRLESPAAGRRPTRFKIVTAGRLIPLKGMTHALQAFAAIHRRWPESTLVVMGDGPERRRLEAEARRLGIRGAVDFLGHVSHERAIDEMLSAEILVLLSRTERLPNVVKEGMACGCICVTTATPGIEELVVSGTHGFVVPHGDVPAVVAAVDDVFSRAIDVDGIVARARLHIAENFDIRVTTAQYRAHWSAAVAARAARRESQPTGTAPQPPVGVYVAAPGPTVALTTRARTDLGDR